jgi:uncharacterized MAPEG superfamily protein
MAPFAPPANPTQTADGGDMHTELMLLAWSALLCLALALPYATGLTLTRGLPVMAGNREGFAEPTGWMGRAKRAHLNMVENLVPFAALIAAAALLNKGGSLTVLGAELFFWARLAHAIIYIAGIPYLRTLAYLVAVIGMVLIFIATIG